MIFSRKKAGGGRHAARRRERDEFGVPVDDDLDAEPGPTTGPFDVADAPDAERLDLGSLKVPVPPGVELRVQADPDGQVQQVLLTSGESALQLGVFAAPRTEGIWDEVRADIRKQLFTDGVAAEESDGEYGVELRARIRATEGMTDIRFIGIDGPRWMVRAVYQGAAATDPAAAGPLATALHGLVVDRGSEAMPVRDPLPLRLPREVAEQAAGQRAETQPAAAEPPAPDESVATPTRPRAAAGQGTRAGQAKKSGGRRPSPRPRHG
jgi:hypothetical protein